MEGDRTAMAAAVEAAPRPAIPRVLTALFFTEAWERFSFYGMRAILLYYLYYPSARGGLGLPTRTALTQVSAYAALIYLSGAAGGWLADRVCGARRATLFGGLSIAAGHLLLALSTDLPGTYAGLLLIVAGTGLLKTNVSAVVGAAYRSDESSRRIAGFALFYVGVSLGGFVGPIVVGWCQQRLDFHVAFGVTAVGMLLGLLCFTARWNSYGEITQRAPNPLTSAERGRCAAIAGSVVVALALLFTVAGLFGHLDGGLVVDLITWCALAIAANYFRLLLRRTGTTPDSRARVRRFAPVFLAGGLFALLSNQAFSSLALFAATRVDTTVLGWSFPVAWLSSVETAGIVLFGPVLSWWWSRHGAPAVDPGGRTARVLTLAGAAFMVIALGTTLSGGAKVSVAWIVLAYLMLAFCDATVGSLGLAAASRLGQARHTSQGLGLWFMGGAAGNGIGAQLVKLFDPAHPAEYFAATGAATVLLALAVAWYARRTVSPRSSRTDALLPADVS